MKKLLTLFILLFFISSCNVSSTSLSPSSNTQSSSSSTVAASIDSITISTTSSLRQFVGINSTVVINAQVSGATGDVSIDWYVNDVRSLTQNGNTFEFLTNTVNSYAIFAQVGNVKSNVINYELAIPSFNVASVKDTSSTQIQIVSDSGLSFSIPGLSIATSSTYNILNRTYTLNLLSPMTQGTTYNIRMSKSGFNDLVFPFLYENRTISVGFILYDGKRILPDADGIYKITKPFTDSNSPSTADYTLSFAQKNLEGANVPISIITNVPATATAIAPYQTTITVQKDVNISRNYTLSSNSVNGLYVHNVQIGGLPLTVRVNVVPATPFLDLGTPIIYDDATPSGGGYAAMSTPFAKDADDDYIKDVIKPEANTSTYIVYRPYNGVAKELTFLLDAENFQTPIGYPADGNPFTILAAVSGPFGSAMNYAATVNTLVPSYPFRATLGSNYRVSQYIDNKTLLGTYNYSFTAVGVATSLSKNIIIIVREFTAELEPVIKYNGETLKANTDGSFTLFKPLGSNQITTSIQLKVKNYESPIYGLVASGEGIDAVYDVDGSGSETVLRYYLNYSVAYSGPLSGLASSVAKIGVELGQTGLSPNADGVVIDDTTSQEATPKTYKRFKAAGSFATVTLTGIPDETNYPSSSIFAQMATLNAASFPGIHTFNIRIGRLFYPLTFKVEEPKPLINVKDTSVKYGATADTASEDNVTLDETDGKYYVDGKNGFLIVNVFPFGMPSGTYPYTFTTKTPSGLFQSVSNNVALTLRVDNISSEGPPIVYSERYDGTLKFPSSGIGSDMNVSVKLTEEGEYIYSYLINGVSRVVTIVVLPSPQLKDESVSFNDVPLAYFEGYYYTKHATVNRFLEINTIPLNIEDDYTYVLTTDGSFPTGQALTDAKEEIAIVNGKVVVGITLNSSTSASDVVSTYFISVYDGNTRVGEITKVMIVSQPSRSTVFFNSNGGTVVTPITQAVGSSVSLPSPPTRTGNKFLGWFNNPAFEGSAITSAFNAAENDLVLFAKWTNQFTITFSKGTGAAGGSNTVTATFGAAMPTATAPTTEASGFTTFLGYFSEPDGAGTKYYNANMTSNSNWNLIDNTTLYAHWE
jgi:hypothetical protein